MNGRRTERSRFFGWSRAATSLRGWRQPARCLQLDPLSLYTNTNAGWFYILSPVTTSGQASMRYATIDMFRGCRHTLRYAFGQGEARDAQLRRGD